MVATEYLYSGTRIDIEEMNELRPLPRSSRDIDRIYLDAKGLKRM